jgi:hypothetical protein
METYTKEEVEELLEKQRSICYRNAIIEEFEYINPYSENDGQITKRISKDSIMNAKLELR